MQPSHVLRIGRDAGAWYWTIDLRGARSLSVTLPCRACASRDGAADAGLDAAWELGLIRVGGNIADGYLLARRSSVEGQ